MDNTINYSDNIFIARAKKLYDALQYKNCSGEYPEKLEQETINKLKDKHIIGNIYYKKVEPVCIYKYSNLCEQYKHYSHNLCINPLLFNHLWQFCQFVRWAEKVVFYKNHPDRVLYVDSAIDDLDCRMIVYTDRKCGSIAKGDFQIMIKMEKIINPAYNPNTLSDILSIDKNNTPKYFKSMKIVIERLYGKQLKNHFTIIEDDSIEEIFGESDKILYDNIENKFSKAMESTINEVLDLIQKSFNRDDM